MPAAEKKEGGGRRYCRPDILVESVLELNPDCPHISQSQVNLRFFLFSALLINSWQINL